MHGNVWEWCYDNYSNYPTDSVIEHIGISGSYQVSRGGSWQYFAWGARSANRDWASADDEGNNRGFRLCLSPVSR